MQFSLLIYKGKGPIMPIFLSIKACKQKQPNGIQKHTKHFSISFDFAFGNFIMKYVGNFQDFPGTQACCILFSDPLAYICLRNNAQME